MFHGVRNIYLPLARACRFSTTSFLHTKEKFIRISGHDVNYLKVGNGAHNVLLAPGAFGTIWTDLNLQLQGFDKSKFTIVIWEAPGYGKSRPPNKVMTRDYQKKDAIVAYELMKALNIPKYSVVGWCAGAGIGAHMAAMFSETIDKLVLTSTSPLILPNEMKLYERLRNLDNWSPGTIEDLILVYGKATFAEMWGYAVDCYLDILKNHRGNHYCDILHKIKCPTFILHGEKDPFYHIHHAYFLHASILKSRLHVYPEGDHWIQKTYAVDYNRRVQDFLLSVD